MGSGAALRLRPQGSALPGLLLQLRPGTAVARCRWTYWSGVLQMRLGRVGKGCLLSVGRRTHSRGGLFQRGATQGTARFPDGRPVRLGLWRRGAVPHEILPLVQSPSVLERGEVLRR